MTEKGGTEAAPRREWGRRSVLKAISAAGIGSAVFSRALEALAQGPNGPKVTPEMLQQAEWISGVKLTDEQRKLMLEGAGQQLGDFAKIRAVPLDNGVPPALLFDPAPFDLAAAPGPLDLPEQEGPDEPDSWDDLAFAPVTELAAHLRSRQVSSVELTRTYLDRISRFGKTLSCFVSVLEEQALKQAEKADREIAAGRYRGPLHGIPWGVKDLFSVPGTKTTWGAAPYKDQTRHERATVVARLDEAGAVLVGKTSVGELAWGDTWFGGVAKNPWKTDQGSSGSSAGSASATAAGLVGFAIGTETWGSIVSPCTRCGASGLRPTFGRVSRYGAMALAWSMDKVGPIARSIEDCAIVFHAIQGSDGLDATAVDRPFTWRPRRDPRTLRIGVAESLFDEDYTKWADKDDEKPGFKEWKEIDRATLATLEELGLELKPVKFPDALPVGALSLILSAEAATAFDELTRSGRDAQLVRQVADAWPTVFRLGQTIPAVEYIRANRVRTLVMRETAKLMEDFDVIVVPSFGGDVLLRTNLTGHPAVVVPNGFRRSDGTPTSITFLGRLWGESEALQLAAAFQEATDFHLLRPPRFAPGEAPGDPEGHIRS
jgi:Asp-tRNA(Asn)/Glu-tRNA(Gln) amidotransferase A subunit family amidase